MKPLDSTNPWFSKGKVSDEAGESVSFLFRELEARGLVAGEGLGTTAGLGSDAGLEVEAGLLGSFFTWTGMG